MLSHKSWRLFVLCKLANFTRRSTEILINVRTACGVDCSDSEMENRPRPYPSVWHTFERTINGKIRKFWVQDLTENHADMALKILVDYFVRDEPLCRSLKLKENEKSLKFALELWREVLKKKCSLACFTKLDSGEEKLVAVNFCYKASVHEEAKKCDDELTGLVVGAVNYLYSLKDPYKELGVEEYLTALGLVTIPEYRGFNIGGEVLKSREKLCAALGLKASLTVFTSPAAQRLAEKVGYKDLVAMTYDELEKMNPTMKFPNINEYSKCIRSMYILYE